MYWTRLEEKLFKEDTEKSLCRVFSALLSNDNKVSLLASKPQDFKSDSS